MGDAQSVIDAVKGGVGTLSNYFVNFSSEFGVIGDVIVVVIAPAIGILISAWGVIDFLKLRKGQGASSPMSIVARFIVGPLTINIVGFVHAISGSVFGEREFESAETMLQSYVTTAENNVDPVKGGLAALLGFFVIVGWISALRAMVAFARMGSPSENGYELFRTGAARLIAATFLCMFQFVIDDIIASAGGGDRAFSSMLNL